MNVRIQAGSLTTGDRTIPPPANRGNDVIGVHGRLLAAGGDGLLNHCHRVFGPQLQDPHVLSRSGGSPSRASKAARNWSTQAGNFHAVNTKE
jgi:hypothetical protein